jgi:hypothetical protein
MLAVSLVVLLGGTLAVNSAAGATTARGTAAAAQPPAPPPLPVPTGDSTCQPKVDPLCTTTTTRAPAPSTQLPLPTEQPSALPSCDPSLPVQPCQPTDTPTPGSGGPATSNAPCAGEGCIPQPTTSAPPTGGGGGQPGPGDDGEADCGITDIGGCITNAINAFFRGIVTAALNPLLDLLSKTLLTTPTPDSLPRIGELWTNSWQILLACYALLVLIAGVLVMGYETLQTRHSVKEVAPRIVVGFLAGALSLWVATKGIQIANGLAQAVMGGGVDANSAGHTLRNLVLGSLGGGIFIIFIGIFLAGMLIVLLVTYVVRVALTVILVAGAPIALMFHALPQTEGIARWWWKAFGGCLAIQVAQSLTLITAMKVFLAPGGFTLFGPTVSGLVNLLVALALMYILFKIPFWILGSLRGGGSRSLLGSIMRGFLAYKTFGLLAGRARSGGARGPRPSGGGGNGGGGPADPYARTRSTGDGQYVLPLAGVRRSRPAATPKPAPSAGKPSAARGRQFALPLGDDWPENKPVLGRDGQYRLPLDVQRSKPAPPPPGQGVTGGRPRGRPRGGGQLELPFDPYKGNRATRSGQYPLPFDGIKRVPATPASPPTGARPSAAPTRPARHPGSQLRLPLDLPKPPRPTPPPPVSGGGQP